MERVEKYKLIMLFAVFSWAVKHTIRGMKEDFHKEYKRHNKIKNDIEYIGVTFRRCLKFGIIGKKFKGFDIEKEFFK